MNNILTAKEWLEKETFKDGIMTSKNKEKLMLSDLVEKYANYKNRILEDRIKQFREYITDTPYLELYEESLLVNEYDKYFNIENKQ